MVNSGDNLDRRVKILDGSLGLIETDLEKYTKLPKSVFSEYLASTGKCLYETLLKKETKVRGLQAITYVEH